jgi:methyltransferase
MTVVLAGAEEEEGEQAAFSRGGEWRILSGSAAADSRRLSCKDSRAMIEYGIGAAQIAALLVLLQRGLEEIYSARNTARLIAAGGREAGRDYYPVVAITHLAWIAAIFLLIPAASPIIVPLLVLYLALQVVRYWVIATLGRYWTHRIITLESAPVVRAGPYRYLRHPNYAVTIAETFLLPLVFGDTAVAVIFGCVWSAVLYYKIILEDAALAERRGG